jgi:hypothetical protein
MRMRLALGETWRPCPDFAQGRCLFDKVHFMARAGEAEGGCQAPHAGADDQNVADRQRVLPIRAKSIRLSA